MTQKTNTGRSSKKDLRAKLSDQLHTALAEFKDAIHEKKWQKLVKKAARLFAEGLHHNKSGTKTVSKKAAMPKPQPVPAAKKTAAKKTAPKKSAVKKTAKKTAKKK